MAGVMVGGARIYLVNRSEHRDGTFALSVNV